MARQELYALQLFSQFYKLWPLLLSHHPPSDWDHTVQVGKLRLCVRCLGIWCGFVAVFLVASNTCLFLPIWALFLLPCPAVCDFLFHELGYTKGHNLLRWSTGVLLGGALGLGLMRWLHGETWLGVGLLSWFGMLEILAAAVLRKTGRMENFIERYEAEIRTIQRTLRV